MVGSTNINNVKTPKPFGFIALLVLLVFTYLYATNILADIYAFHVSRLLYRHANGYSLVHLMMIYPSPFAPRLRVSTPSRTRQERVKNDLQKPMHQDNREQDNREDKP